MLRTLVRALRIVKRESGKASVLFSNRLEERPRAAKPDGGPTWRTGDPAAARYLLT